MILEYTYLDENNELKSNIIKNEIDDYHPSVVKFYLPSKLQNSYMNIDNSFWKFHSIKRRPALIIKDNNKIIKIEYFKDGFNHRDDGPAIEYLRYEKLLTFYLNGKFILPYKFAEETNHLICKSCRTFCKQLCFLGD